MIASVTAGASRPEQPAERRVVAAVLVDRADDRQPERLCPAAKSSAPQPGAMWTMPVPSSSPTSVQATTRCSYAASRANASRDGGQVVERALVAPADELGARALLDDLERAPRGLLERPAAEPERVLALRGP